MGKKIISDGLNLLKHKNKVLKKNSQEMDIIKCRWEKKQLLRKQSN